MDIEDIDVRGWNVNGQCQEYGVEIIDAVIVCCEQRDNAKGMDFIERLE